MTTAVEPHEILHHGPLAEVLRRAAEEAGDENIVEEVFILGGDDDPKVVDGPSMLSKLREAIPSFDGDAMVSKSADLVDVSKSTVAGSKQSKEEIGQSSMTSTDIVNPPYPPELMSQFLEVDEVHFRCVKTKVTDAVLRDYDLVARKPVRSDEEVDEPDKKMGADDDDDMDAEMEKRMASKSVDESATTPEDDMLDPKEVSRQTEVIRKFLESCNDVVGFEGVLELAGMDYEAIGWAAIEVIRGMDGTVKKLAHIPASRVRVKKGWTGFVELLDAGKVTHYQMFGQKWVSTTRKNLWTDEPEPYDPEEDGKTGGKWKMINRETGKATSSFKESANEILWIAKHHPNTTYYGCTDVLPAVGFLLGNVHIRDYMLQFFEHNTVPRYAIILEGAKMSPSVIKAITEYFSQGVKGRAHKTLIIPVPSMKGEVKLRFEKLQSDSQEGSFQETHKNNAQGIMVAHGVSAAIIGINETASLGSGKGLSQAEIYKDRIVTPSQRVWSRGINKIIRLGLRVLDVSLIFSPLDIRDYEAEQKVLAGYQDKGVLCINEVRKTANLGEPIPGGDRHYILAGNAPIFVDELTSEVSGHVKEAEDQIAALEDEARVMKMDHAIQQNDAKMKTQQATQQANLAKQTAAAAAAAAKSKPKPTEK